MSQTELFFTRQEKRSAVQRSALLWGAVGLGAGLVADVFAAGGEWAKTGTVFRNGWQLTYGLLTGSPTLVGILSGRVDGLNYPEKYIRRKK